MTNSELARPPMLTEPSTAPQPDVSNQFKRCMRDRLRLAREIAALRSRFSAAVDEFERVIRTMQALAPSLGVDDAAIRHPTDPDWGPAALLVYANALFLKDEQATTHRLLHLLP